MKILRCRDAGFDCEGIIRGESEDEVLNQAAKHALDVHGVATTPELAEQLKSLFIDEKQE